MVRCDSQDGATADHEGRILVVSKRYIGDTILAIPFLRNLRAAFPDAPIDVFAEGAARLVLADCPYQDELIEWSRPRGTAPRSSLGALRAQAAWLRSRGYARAYLLKRSFSVSLLAFLAGIPHRVGQGSECGRVLLSRTVSSPRGRHQAELYLDLLRADGIAVDDGHNENWVAPAVAARIDEVLSPTAANRRRVFLAVRPTAAQRAWPDERWTRVVEGLVTDRECEIFLCGSRDDVRHHDAIRRLLDPAIERHVHDLSHVLSLRETAGLLARMDLCVGIDTGLVHLASSFGVPVVVIFGPSDPNRWCPWMSPSEVVRSPRVKPLPFASLRRGDARLRWPLGVAAMEDVAVADVLAGVDRLCDQRVDVAHGAVAVSGPAA